MARCPNRNTPEYKALLQEFKTNIATDNVINSWQDLNNSTEFPSLSEAKDFMKQYKINQSLRKQEFAQTLLRNLSRLGYVRKYQNGYFVQSLVKGQFRRDLLNSNVLKIQNYMAMNNIPEDVMTFNLADSGRTYFITINDSAFTNQDILPKTRGFNEPKTLKILAHLQNVFPELKIEIATVDQAKNYYDALPSSAKANVKFEDIKSFYVGGKVYLIKGRVTDETAIEEVLHPFVDTLFIQNRQLFDNLLAEARENFPKLDEEISEIYSAMKGFSQKQRDLELVTQSLTRHFNDEYEKAPTKTFLDRIREFLEWFRTVVNDFHKYLTGLTIDKANEMTSVDPSMNMEGLDQEEVNNILSVINLKSQEELKEILKNIKDENVRFSYFDEKDASLSDQIHKAIFSKKPVAEINALIAQAKNVALNAKFLPRGLVFKNSGYTIIKNAVSFTDVTFATNNRVKIKSKATGAFDGKIEGAFTIVYAPEASPEFEYSLRNYGKRYSKYQTILIPKYKSVLFSGAAPKKTFSHTAAITDRPPLGYTLGVEGDSWNIEIGDAENKFPDELFEKFRLDHIGKSLVNKKPLGWIGGKIYRNVLVITELQSDLLQRSFLINKFFPDISRSSVENTYDGWQQVFFSTAIELMKEQYPFIERIALPSREFYASRISGAANIASLYDKLAETYGMVPATGSVLNGFNQISLSELNKPVQNKTTKLYYDVYIKTYIKTFVKNLKATNPDIGTDFEIANDAVDFLKNEQFIKQYINSEEGIQYLEDLKVWINGEFSNESEKDIINLTSEDTDTGGILVDSFGNEIDETYEETELDKTVRETLTGQNERMDFLYSSVDVDYLLDELNAAIKAKDNEKQNVIKQILGEVQSQGSSDIKFMYSDNGTILGFTYNNQIYINKDAEFKTVIEEAGHLWIDKVKETNPFLYNQGLEKVRDSEYLTDVLANPFYVREALKLGDENSLAYKAYLEEEALSKAIKDNGSKLVGENKKSFVEWLKDLWNELKKIIGFENFSVEQIKKMPLSQFSRIAASEAFSQLNKPTGVTKDFIAKLEKKQQAPTSVKPGVAELFESNPELANSVYEALGFKTNITQDNKSYYRGQIEKPTIDKDGNLVLYAREDELYKRAGLPSKGVSMTDDLESAVEYGIGQLEVAKNLVSEENIGIDLERELDRLDENGYYLIQIPKSISNEIVKEAGEVKVVGDKIIIPKGQYKIEQIIEDADTQITPQQKQQALQLYSQYLDSIFPGSGVKDILYHGSLDEITKFNKDQHFGTFDQAVLRVSRKADDEDRYDDISIYPVVVNVTNPKTVEDVGFDWSKEIKQGKEEGYDSLTYFNKAENYVSNKGEYLNLDNSYLIFDPNNSHLLGSEQDMEMFRKFASEEIQVTPTLAIGEIKSTAKLTDIAKLLNTNFLRFDLQVYDDTKVKYALSESKKEVINAALDSANDIQKDIINRLFGYANITPDSIDSLSVSTYDLFDDSTVVVLNPENHTYYDIINPDDVYTSVTTAIKGKLKNEEDVQLNITLGNDFDRILDSIVSNKTLAQILESGKIKILNEEQVTRAFNDLQEKIQDLRSDGSVPISQVVFFDQATKIAGTADLVLINPQGRLKILDLKTSKSWYASEKEKYDKEWDLDEDSLLKTSGIVSRLSTRQQHNLQVNLYRRMAENMGYEIARDEYATSTYHIHVDISGERKDQKFEGTFEVDGWVPHPPSQNSVYVNKLIPVNKQVTPERALDLALNTFSFDFTDPEDNLSAFEQAPEDLTDSNGYTEFNTAFNALQKYKTALLNRREAIEKIKSGIYMDRKADQIIENIDNTVGAIMVALSEGGKLISSTYTDLLRDAIKEVDKFTEYMLDPNNFDKNEYINYALNFDRFLITFNGLTEIEKSGELNDTQAKLVLSLETKLRELGGTKTKSGIIDAAIMNYVKETVKNTSNRNFTEAELNELMRMADDISIEDLMTRDLATSTDTLLAIMDKIYKAKKQEMYDKQDIRSEEIINAANKLLKLSPTSNRNELYKYMMEFDDEGNFTGRYVEKLGKQYYTRMESLRKELFDEEGNWKEYREIDDVNTASPEDIDYNKTLYKAKQAYKNFWKAETIGVNNRPIDGEYHGYTEEFKQVRDKHEIFVANGPDGYWIKKKGISDKAYLNYKLKYFDTVDIKRAIKKDGVFTGKVIDDNIQVPKVKYRFAREITSKGENMLNPKYQAIMNPTDALGEAQKEWYEVFMKNYDELLNKLPVSIRDQMLGKMPLVQSNLINSLKQKGNLFTKLWAKSTRSVKNLTTETSHTRRVVVDETGQFVDTLPIYFVGNTRDEEALTVLEAKLDQLNKERKMGAINAIDYKEQKKELNGKIQDIKNRPAKSEISMDAADSLLKFTAMAEHYETMSTIEDTMNAFLYVIKNRDYRPANSNISKVVEKGKNVIPVGRKKNDTEANAVMRAKKFMSMVFYDSEEVTKGMTAKISDFLINASSMTYVAFNPFGNVNNYVMGRLNNNIELLGQRFYSAQAALRATSEWNKRALPDMVKRFGMHGYKIGMGGQYDPAKPMSKYEAFVDFLRMMDMKSDLRETRGSTAQQSWFQTFFIEKLGYGLQDAAEYNVQTKVGMSLVIDTILKNKTTGETLSLYDAAEFDSVTHKLKFKDGFDTVVKKNGTEVAFDDKFRYDLRNRIREVNKQIHGNYAREDRMVMQSIALGRLAAQFHKWVAPAIRARFGREYFDENLGWMEGRYKSFWQFMGYFFKNLDKIEMTGKIIGPKMKEGFLKDYGYKGDGSQDDAKAENKLYNTYRTLGELAIIISVMAVRQILSGIWVGDDDDSDIEKRLENAILFQADRSVKEMRTFIPIIGFSDLYQMAKSPIPSARTLAEYGQAISSTMLTGFNGIKYLATDDPQYFQGNKDIVYQRKPDKGNLKMAKEWKDAIPIWYTFQRWASYDTVSDFYIK